MCESNKKFEAKVHLSGCKYVSLKTGDDKTFTVIFNGVFSHREIVKMLPNCTPIAAGFARQTIDKSFGFEGYSTTLRIGGGDIDELTCDDGIFSGVITSKWDIAIATDNIECLQSNIEIENLPFTLVLSDDFRAEIVSEYKCTERVAYSFSRLF